MQCKHACIIHNGLLHIVSCGNLRSKGAIYRQCTLKHAIVTSGGNYVQYMAYRVIVFIKINTCVKKLCSLYIRNQCTLAENM